ncbi:protein translocase SEC6 [Ascodesmis nigricans]|uniref:Protein translocase SEC6 n=1 Tax=Ascodesmis nigricans TaxID=341454 RepID=A0A4V3SJL1_9PEZI|nr:protein translocase SEC6 [Ascodesmis nigricans]
MSDQFSQLTEIPREFVKDGTMFINRCTKPDKREFIKISQAVGVGFVVMGVIGYIVKIIHIPINNILVYVHPILLPRRFLLNITCKRNCDPSNRADFVIAVPHNWGEGRCYGCCCMEGVFFDGA